MGNLFHCNYQPPDFLKICRHWQRQLHLLFLFRHQ